MKYFKIARVWQFSNYKQDFLWVASSHFLKMYEINEERNISLFSKNEKQETRDYYLIFLTARAVTSFFFFLVKDWKYRNFLIFRKKFPCHGRWLLKKRDIFKRWHWVIFQSTNRPKLSVRRSAHIRITKFFWVIVLKNNFHGLF